MVTGRVLLVSLLVLYFPRLDAATADITYPLSGGIAILSGSGTVLATVAGRLLGVPFSLTRTGVVSGATSWNIAGDLTLSFEQGEDAPSFPSAGNRLDLTRRAGTIVIDFPLIPIGELDPLNIDLLVVSHDSAGVNSAKITGSGVSADADGVGGILTYEAPTAIQISGPLITAFTLPAVFNAYFAAQNEPGGSLAAVAPVEGSFNEALSVSASDCQDIGFVDCGLDLTVTYDFTGLTSTMTATAATGTSTAHLPVPHPVPLPPALWLLVPAVGALGLMRTESRRRTEATPALLGAAH